MNMDVFSNKGKSSKLHQNNKFSQAYRCKNASLTVLKSRVKREAVDQLHSRSSNFQNSLQTYNSSQSPALLLLLLLLSMFFLLLNTFAFEYFFHAFETPFRAFEWPPFYQVLH